MWYFDRMEREKPLDRRAEYFHALDAVRNIADIQRKWDFRNKLSGQPAGVLLAITPRFMLDNPEMFVIPEELEVFDKENNFAYRTHNNAMFFRDVVRTLANANEHQDSLLSDFLREATDEAFSELLAYAFMALDGQDFNIRRHPTLLYRAFIANIPRMIRQEGMSAGEHYTEPWIADLMAELVNIEDGDLVYDNACGMGIMASVATVSTKAVVYAQDCVFQYAAMAHVLMLMIGKHESRVSVGDSILDPSIGGDYGPFSKFLIEAPFGFRTREFKEFQGYGVYNDFRYPDLFRTDYRNDQWAFVRQAFKVLSEKGSGAALVNIAMLNRDGRQYRDTRAVLVEEGFISAVIELPVNCRSFTGIKYSIVLFDRVEKHEAVYFLDLGRKEVESYFVRNSGKVELRYGESEKVAGLVHDRREIEGVSKIVPISDIIKNDYRLSVGTYIRDNTNKEEAIRAGASSWELREKLKREYVKADTELEALLAEYAGFRNNGRG